MKLIDYVKNLALPGETVQALHPWTVLRIMPDGSVMLYKNNLVGIDAINLSRYDIEALRRVRLPFPILTPESPINKNVHTEHCCVWHGCKYGNEDCPVVNHQKSQSFPCETCLFSNEFEGTTPAPVAEPYVITKVIETCSGCPAQWSARTDDGRFVYIRYRQFRVDVNVVSLLEESFISAYGGDGVLSYEEMVSRTQGYLDFRNAKFVETQEEI
jgi:hypothetical protein